MQRLNLGPTQQKIVESIIDRFYSISEIMIKSNLSRKNVENTLYKLHLKKIVIRKNRKWKSRN